MSDVEARVYERLRELEIPFEAAAHEAVHTIEDCAVAERLLGARMPKNLFLTPRNQSVIVIVFAFLAAVYAYEFSGPAADLPYMEVDRSA